MLYRHNDFEETLVHQYVDAAYVQPVTDPFMITSPDWKEKAKQAR